MKQNQAPFFESLVNYIKREIYPLHTPAHRGIYSAPGIEKILTPFGLACDLPSMEPIDSHFHPHGCIAEAQHLAADLYGATECFFLMNGSTIGIHAMMLATLSTGDKVILSRQVHVSIMAGLILTGACPVYLPLRYLKESGPIPPTAQDVSHCLSEHADVKAVMLTNPTYYGIGRDLKEIAQICHDRKIPLLVDEAHGAHLNFLSNGFLPSAISSGADAVVQSSHKMLGALLGTAQLLLCKSTLLNKERVQQSLNLLQSTSSSYLLLTSLDLTRRWMAKKGPSLFSKAIRLAKNLRAQLNKIHGLRTLEVSNHDELYGCMSDPLRLVINVSRLGISGYSCGKTLFNEFKIYDEFCDEVNIIYVLSVIDSQKIFSRLEKAYRKISKRSKQPVPRQVYNLNFIPAPSVILTPREAFAHTRKRIPLHESVGCICSETISIYPPGIPIICPGEVITQQIVDLFSEIAKRSIVIFAEDIKLNTITIISS